MQSPESCCFENCEAPKTATDLDDRAPVAAMLRQRYCRFCIPQFLWTRLELSFRGCKIPWKNCVNRAIASSSCKTVARPLQLILHEKISLSFQNLRTSSNQRCSPVQKARSIYHDGTPALRSSKPLCLQNDHSTSLQSSTSCHGRAKVDTVNNIKQLLVGG